MSTEDKKSRRARGDGGVRWDEKRQRYIAEKTVGYDGRGKRIVKTGTGKSESAALRNLRDRIREYEAGLMPAAHRVTVAQVCEDWLKFERSDVGEKTKEGDSDKYRVHIKPHLGGRRLKDLRPDEVDKWLLKLSSDLSTSTLKQVRSVLRRSINRAVKRGLAERNVVDLCPAPKGRTGRPSKSLTLQQASDILEKTRKHHMHPYIAVSLLVGVRPEEVRALRWDRVHLDEATPYIEVWRSVRAGGDTKTKKSKRTLAVSGYVAAMLERARREQVEIRERAGDRWQENDLVFPSLVGTEQDAHNVRRMFRDALRLVPGIDPDEWVPYELRHSFVSILSERGMPVEEISRLMGHKGTAVTELVYRHELRPVIESGASVMDSVFPLSLEDAGDDTEDEEGNDDDAA
ncbi:tyrosine recombinase XerC [Nocardioides sp. NPDC057767]|uniref:site-specific integrase n=1 Tax=unclassified Nocardioides TaxID=2615069 RepID=UPI00366F5271